MTYIYPPKYSISGWFRQVRLPGKKSSKDQHGVGLLAVQPSDQQPTITEGKQAQVDIKQGKHQDLCILTLWVLFLRNINMYLHFIWLLHTEMSQVSAMILNYRRGAVNLTKSTDLIHKSQNAPAPYPTMLHSEQKCAHFCSEWSIVGYGTGAFWDIWTWSTPWLLMPGVTRSHGIKFISMA